MITLNMKQKIIQLHLKGLSERKITKETGNNVIDALEQVNELEDVLDQSKETMYKLSNVIRVSASTLDELKQRYNKVKDFYDDLNVKLVRPFDDMICNPQYILFLILTDSPKLFRLQNILGIYMLKFNILF